MCVCFCLCILDNEEISNNVHILYTCTWRCPTIIIIEYNNNYIVYNLFISELKFVFIHPSMEGINQLLISFIFKSGDMLNIILCISIFTLIFWSYLKTSQQNRRDKKSPKQNVSGRLWFGSQLIGIPTITILHLNWKLAILVNVPKINLISEFETLVDSQFYREEWEECLSDFIILKTHELGDHIGKRDLDLILIYLILQPRLLSICWKRKKF